MAESTAGVRIKPLFTGNGLWAGFGAFQRRCRVKCYGSRGGGNFSYSLSGDRKRKLRLSTVGASRSSSQTTNAGGVFDEVLEDDGEYEIDDLAGFRGLVLDISYRFACNSQTLCVYTLKLLIIYFLIYIQERL